MIGLRNLSKQCACELLGKTRQGYNRVHELKEERERREKVLLEAVNEIRAADPGIGGYKLWLMMKDMFGQGWVPGRDRFLRFLSRNRLVLPRPKPRHTTNSNHRYRKYSNLVRDFEPSAPNQLWVSDITYVDLERGCCYLHLVTDAYSHKIVGWCLADSLMALFTLRALRDAVEQTGREDLDGLIHHSDRGSQYCSDAYVAELRRHNIRISMTEDYKPTDNAIAERANGIIKTELIYRVRRFKGIAQARQRIGEFISFYNERRPHMSIGMKTPSQVHAGSPPEKKMWGRGRKV